VPQVVIYGLLDGVQAKNETKEPGGVNRKQSEKAAGRGAGKSQTESKHWALEPVHLETKYAG
jgi:hypothetical protein